MQDPDDWFIKMCGGGAMIAEPKVFGRLFIDAPVRDYDDLEFVCRGVSSGRMKLYQRLN